MQKSYLNEVPAAGIHKVNASMLYKLSEESIERNKKSILEYLIIGLPEQFKEHYISHFETKINEIEALVIQKFLCDYIQKNPDLIIDEYELDNLKQMNFDFI